MSECGAVHGVRNVSRWSYARRMAAEAREAGDEKAVAYWEHIAELVDKCPPLTDRQIVELRAIFASAAPRVIATTRQPGRAPDGEA